MKTIRTKVYSFSELSQDAKQKAIEWYRNSDRYDDFYIGEIGDSCKAMAELFNLNFGRQCTDLRYSHIDDNILELKGVRLYKYIVNNYYNQLFKPKYIKSIDRHVNWKPFICERYTGKGTPEYTFIYSRNKKSNSCVLRGVCNDENILEPVYKFLSCPEKSTTFEDLIKDIESAIEKTFNDNDECINSDEYITDQIEANDYLFTKDGKRFNQ